METKNNQHQQTMETAYKLFKNSIHNHNNTTAHGWLKQHGFTATTVDAVFISKAVHHNKPIEFIQELESAGLMTRIGNKGYVAFGAKNVAFPLRNETDSVVNFCSVNIKNNQITYLNREGLYPHYPSLATTKLFITQNIIEAATILQSNVLKEGESVLALYEGRQLVQHEEAIKKLTQLKEVIFIH